MRDGGSEDSWWGQADREKIAEATFSIQRPKERSMAAVPQASVDTRRVLTHAWVLAALAIAVANIAPAQAQTYPTKTIKLVVPFGPGGPTDVAARVVAQVVPSGLGQSVVIENRPGAGGALGSKAVAGAEPDGYTLLIGTSATLGVVPALVKNPGYDPIKSFAPVAKIADSTTILVVHPSFPASSIRELVAHAKANPGKLSYASAGPGNQTHLAAELLKTRAGIELVHVPYKSGAEMVTAVLGQQLQMSFPDISILLPLIREAKLKALAVTSAARHPQLPDVPTMGESGISDYVTTFWTGVVAPAGTPAGIVDRLNAAINDGLRSPPVQEALAKVGAQPAPGSPQNFASFIAAETRKWSAIAKTSGISLD
jgi:tripartite-type tricarboxylate transporter receptor subunit TctC